MRATRCSAPLVQVVGGRGGDPLVRGRVDEPPELRPDSGSTPGRSSRNRMQVWRSRSRARAVAIPPAGHAPACASVLQGAILWMSAAAGGFDRRGRRCRRKSGCLIDVRVRKREALRLYPMRRLILGDRASRRSRRRSRGPTSVLGMQHSMRMVGTCRRHYCGESEDLAAAESKADAVHGDEMSEPARQAADPMARRRSVGAGAFDVRQSARSNPPRGRTRRPRGGIELRSRRAVVFEHLGAVPASLWLPKTPRPRRRGYRVRGGTPPVRLELERPARRRTPPAGRTIVRAWSADASARASPLAPRSPAQRVHDR